MALPKVQRLEKLKVSIGFIRVRKSNSYYLELQLVDGEVVGGDSGVVLLVETKDNGVPDGRLVNVDDLAHGVVPVGLRTLDLHIRSTSRSDGGGPGRRPWRGPRGRLSNAKFNGVGPQSHARPDLHGRGSEKLPLLSRSRHLGNGETVRGSRGRLGNARLNGVGPQSHVRPGLHGRGSEKLLLLSRSSHLGKGEDSAPEGDKGGGGRGGSPEPAVFHQTRHR